MTSTWASYLVALATALAAAVALMGAVVVLLVGRVAELHCRVAALVPPETDSRATRPWWGRVE